MSQPDEKKDNTQQPQSGDLANELRELGQQIEQALRNAMENERAKQIQKDVTAGMMEIGGQLQSAIKSIQENPRIQELAERGEEAVHKVRQSQAAHDFQETLARGISQLNDQLAAFAARMRSEAPSDTGSATTGETTRLDPDKDKEW